MKNVFWFATLVLLSMLFIPSTTVDARSLNTAGRDTAGNPANMPAVIFLIRHGEKPPAEADSSDLAPAGVLRAKALPTLFLKAGSGPSRFPRPDVLFATLATKHSNREVETLEPLSAALHMPINNSFEEHDTNGMAKELFSGKYAGKVVLLCWHHSELARLAQALGATDAPRWHDDVFDQIWQIDWVQGKLRFTTLPEQLLPGDASK